MPQGSQGQDLAMATITDERAIVTVPIMITQDLAKDLITLVERTFPICQPCGHNFLRRTGNQKYCSPRCARKGKNARQRNARHRMSCIPMEI
jgi:hypothetical protein